MKRTLTTLALAGSMIFGMSAVPMFAQDAPPPPPPAQQQGMGGMHHGMRHGRMHHRMMRMTPDEQLAHLTKMLDLTAEQQAKLKPILVARDQKMKAMWKQQMQERKQMREQMRSAMKESKDQVDGVLTAEQKQKLDAMMQRRMEHMRHHWGQMHGAPPPPPPPGQAPAQPQP